MATKPKTKPSPVAEFTRMSREIRAKVEALLKCADELPRDDDPIAAGAALAAESKEWNKCIDAVTSAFTRLNPIASAKRHAAAEELADQLRQSLMSHGFSLYGEGNSIFVDGVVHVELEPSAARVKVNGALQSGLSVRALTEAVKAEIGQLLALVTTPTVFLDQLLAAYRHVLLAGSSEFGTQVLTTDLLPWLALRRQTPRFVADPHESNFASYTLQMFRADLFSLFNSSVQDVGDSTFRWSSGSTTKGSVFMFVPSLGRPAHVGRIWFERKGGGQ